ncbi:transmembrane protein 273 [Eschrichtius robustus]|uniref:transmembrane protein 273 n=1 Tax=Eschrichtius robustus TaxID=9764 RepID=UPI0035C1F8C4
MDLGASMLRALLLLLDVGAAQVFATGQPAGAEIDIKYAITGIAVGFAISASFLALKICTIRKPLFDNDSSEQRSTNVGFSDSIELKKRTPRALTEGGPFSLGSSTFFQPLGDWCNDRFP